MSDRHRGITHVAFTVLLCVFPIAFLLTDVLWLVNLRNLRRTHYAVNVLGRLWLVGLISHWFFTGAAVVSCAFLLFRPVSTRTKVVALAALALAVVASIGIQTTMRF